MRAIIPAAGYGTRMNMKPNESKELLLYKGKPLIEHTLDLCVLAHPLVITRKEKTDLIDYCKEKNVETLIIDEEGEMRHTILQSQFYWEKYNVLILPDTIFDTYAVDKILWNLNQGYNACFAMHRVTDPEKWGIIKDGTLCEKPDDLTGEQMAWGVIGFTPYMGRYLFTNYVKKQHIDLDNCNGFILSNFRDLTRDGKIPLD